jgi:hypothetical protein
MIVSRGRISKEEKNKKSGVNISCLFCHTIQLCGSIFEYVKTIINYVCENSDIIVK